MKAILSKKWQYSPPFQGIDIEAMLGEIKNLKPVVAKLLYQKGYADFNSVKAFFVPELKDLHDPFLMQDMKKAAERVAKALKDKEKILVYGDYDVDGACSVAMMYSFLIQHSANVEFYLPDREKEGYGVSEKGIDYAIENNFNLLITLDCGIKAGEKVAKAAKNNIDVIICDHHLPPEILPEAYAVLDPKRLDCQYPYKELCGCGVGFKLIQAVCKTMDLGEECANCLLDLVAVATCCDIVQLTGENRILTYFGLQKLNSDPQPGLKAMIALNNYNRPYSAGDVIFKIGPRINAAGRLFTARIAVQLLIAEDVNKCHSLSREVEKHNTDRKGIDRSITSQALSILEELALEKDSFTSVVYHPEWHKGVIGIVASRLKETFYRPTIVLTESNGKVTGSARSVDGFDIHTAIDACSDLLVQFGGHQQAAGLTMLKENVEDFKQRFEEVVGKTIDKELLNPKEEIDLEVNFEDLISKAEFEKMNDEPAYLPPVYHQLNRFNPCGPGNMSPAFASHFCYSSDTRIVGEDHLKLTVYQSKTQSIKLPAIAFNLGHCCDRIKNGESFSIAYCIEENFWNNTSTLQLVIKDIQFTKDRN